ncbi:MAG: beta-glucosidase [Anaerolineae bacterium]|nr:beta-glucosidase [Anaerolineae bacterium]
MTSKSFPDGFVWGAATASYQIEGGANADGRSPSVWDTFSHTPGKILNGDTGDVACDHYNRWPQDIALLKQLGANAYRFSLAWPRILPEGRGQVNQAGLDFYSQLVDALLEAGITPYVTLYHWDLPQILEDQGGWPARSIVDAFVEYTDVVTRHLGDRVKHWITLNEPMVFTFLGYSFGEHAPGYTDHRLGVQASHHSLLAHGRSVPVIRQNSPGASVGITLNLSMVYPVHDTPEDRQAAEFARSSIYDWFADPVFGQGYPALMLDAYRELGAPVIEDGDMETIAVPIDFLGINNYSPDYVTAKPGWEQGGGGLTPEELAAQGFELTEMGWPVVADGLKDLLVFVNERYQPSSVLITENGAAFADEMQVGRVHDPRRVRYYHDYISAVWEAIQAGVPIDGYFAWSLLDNFEWSFGYARRFGITYVDFETLERTPKSSFEWLKRTIAANAVQPI